MKSNNTLYKNELYVDLYKDLDALNSLKSMPPVILAANISLEMNRKGEEYSPEYFLKNAPTILYPLVQHIHSLEDDIKEIIFKGKTSHQQGMHQVSYPAHLNDLYLNKGVFGAARLLHKLKSKTSKLHGESKSCAESLYKTLNDAFEAYLENNDDETLNTLKKTWDSAIKEAKKKFEELDQNGWTNLFTNLLLLLPTLGGFIVYTAYKTNGRNFLFPFVKSDVSKVVEQLDQTTDTLQLRTTT